MSVRERRVKSPSRAAPAKSAAPAWRRVTTWLAGPTFAAALAGGILLWAALPPLDIWPLAWIAPVPWILLIRRQTLPGPKPYRSIWLAGVLFWLAAVHWLRLPHWATSFGWLGIALILGLHLTIFIGLSRVAVHRLGLSVVVAAPVVYAGMEFARAHFLGGFPMAALAHTQYRWIELIQISDLGADYAVAFLVMLVAAAIGRMIPWEGRPWAVWPVLPAGLAVAAALVYGHHRAAYEPSRPGPRVALIQGSIDTELKFDPKRETEVHEHYFELTAQALRSYRDLDLLIWPETMFRQSLITFEPGAAPPEQWIATAAEFRRLLAKAGAASELALGDVARAFGVPVVLGIDTQHYGRDRLRRYNSAVFLDAHGKLLARYDKLHPVMFGEYVPLADRWPRLAKLTPLQTSLDHGREPVAFAAGNARLAPSICYESVFPHLIRRQITELRARGQTPDVLVNLTNDGWFWGSSELDMHLTCSVFRAIESRRPVLIAANTGFSAWIDSNGRILKRGPRREAATLLAEVRLDDRWSPYLNGGDLPAGLCLAACVLLAAVGPADRWGVSKRLLPKPLRGPA